MKKILLLLVVLVSSVTFAQNNGITYQAVIYSTTGESVPGIKNSNAPLSNKAICLQFSIVDENTQTEYQEKVTVTTDDYGMVNLVIGNGTQTGGYANSFNAIVWSTPDKYLKVSVDQTGNCSSFELISDQVLTYVPFALSANSATSVSGIVGIANGGTNATTVVGTKTNLQLQNVDNTSDLNKPLSTATQTALNTKVDKVAGKDLSTEDFTTAEKTKLASLGGTPDLSGYATIVNLNTKVDKATGKDLSTNDYTTAEKTKLAAISGVNTGDQDLRLYATNANLALKSPLASPNFTGIMSLNNRAEFGQNIEREQPSLKLIGFSKAGTGVNSFWPTQPYAGGGLEIGDGGAVRLVIYRKSSNTFNISTTGSLNEGIGINADSYDPAYTLDINGTLGVRNSITSTGTITAGAVTYPNVDGTSGQVLATNGAGVAAWTSPSGGSSSQWTTSDNDIYFSTGKVGIGLTNPGSLFNTNLDVAGRSSFRINSSTKALIMDGSSGFSRIYTEAASGTPDNLILGTYPNGHTKQLFLKQSNGYVGINNDNPSEQLDVTGSVKAAGFKTPTGTSSQYLMADGSVTSGSSGSSSASVDLTTNQTIAGSKTFSADLNVSGLTIGGTSNTTILGANASGGPFSTTIGNNASSPSSYSVAIGRNSNAMSSYSLAIGGLAAKASESYSLAIGGNAPEATGVYSTAIGGSVPKATALQSTALGSSTTASGQNSTALGYGATVSSNNTIQLGNAAITNVNTNGTLSASGFKTPTGTSSQYLMADGSVSSGSSGSSGPQILTENQRDALNLTSSGVTIFNSTSNQYQGSVYYTTGYNYNYFTTTNYGFTEIRPGFGLTQTFTGKGQAITSANIAVVNMGRVSNTGDFTFAIWDETYQYALFTTTITLSGAGTVSVTIPNYPWNEPRTLPNGPCSIRITSDAGTGGSADFLLNSGASVGSLSNSYWSSLGGTAGGYTTPNTSNQLAIDLFPQNGLRWVSFN